MHGWPSESCLRRRFSRKMPPSEPDGTITQQQPPRHRFKGTRPLQSHAPCGTATGTGPVRPPASTATWARTQTPSSRTAAVTACM